MGKVPADLGECCEMLGLSRNSSRDELKLAFALNRRDVEMAGYDVEAVRKLIKGADDADPLTYEPLPTAAQHVQPVSFTPSKPHALNAVTMLCVLMVVLVATLCIFLWPRYGYKLRSFKVNDPLVEARSGEPYATVLEVNRHHEFSNGKVAPAYLLRLKEDGTEVWYPLNDVHYFCVRD
ncbi:MAG: hypothetical protein O7F16_07550 [Acidobacteria bacterium]|nr:hypothetical protein [Acidobacteriota bacterium]